MQEYNIARTNMRHRPNDPILKSESPRIPSFRKTSGSSSYLTFVKGGYIMTIRPRAIGIEVVPMLKRLRNGTTPGIAEPRSTPSIIAPKIHAVRYRSRDRSLLVVVISRPEDPFTFPPSLLANAVDLFLNSLDCQGSGRGDRERD